MSPRQFRTLAGSLFLVGALLLGLVSPAAAGEDDDLPVDELSDSPDHQFVLTGGPVHIREGDTVEDVVIVDGDAVVDGRVDGPVVVGHGNAVIRGTVTEDVVVFNGRAVIGEGATVEGDVRSSKEPQVADGATVEGDAKRVNFGNAFNVLGSAILIFWWIAVTLSTLVAGLLLVGIFGGLVRRATVIGRKQILPSIGVGAAATIGFPILCGLILLTLVGIPLGGAGLFATGALYLVGYVTGAAFAGNLIFQSKGNAILAFVVGWLLLRVVSLVPVLGGLVTFAATLYGLGILLIAVWETTRTAAPVEDEPAPASPA